MRTPTLAELPPPPAGRTGWPWTEEGERLPDRMPDGRPWPRISITTPSYNQGAYLEETIRSVLLQGYPDIEYMVADGGSSDESVEIIRKYSPWLTWWVSEKDSGQGHAVNKGWERATGSLFAFLNSDDVLLPGAFATAVRAWGFDPDVAMVTGGIASTDAESRVLNTRAPFLEDAGPQDLTLVDHDRWLLPQPSSFFVGEHLERVGRWLREDLRYALDRELIYRLARSGRVVLLDTPVATYRLHETSNTVAQHAAMAAESAQAFDYCQWGGPREARRRARVLRWRIAQGYRLRAVYSPQGRVALAGAIRAALLRPGYLADPVFLRLLGGSALRTVLQASRLYEPLRTLRNTIRDRARDGAAGPVSA